MRPQQAVLDSILKMLYSNEPAVMRDVRGGGTTLLHLCDHSHHCAFDFSHVPHTSPNHISRPEEVRYATNRSFSRPSGWPLPIQHIHQSERLKQTTATTHNRRQTTQLLFITACSASVTTKGLCRAHYYCTSMSCTAPAWNESCPRRWLLKSPGSNP